MRNTSRASAISKAGGDEIKAHECSIEDYHAAAAANEVSSCETERTGEEIKRIPNISEMKTQYHQKLNIEHSS